MHKKLPQNHQFKMVPSIILQFLWIKNLGVA